MNDEEKVRRAIVAFRSKTAVEAALAIAKVRDEMHASRTRKRVKDKLIQAGVLMAVFELGSDPSTPVKLEEVHRLVRQNADEYQRILVEGTREEFAAWITKHTRLQGRPVE